jgi:hypothetical protein
MRNIESKARARGLIRLFQISIPQRPPGDFCNNIGTKLPIRDVRLVVAIGW